MLWLAGILGLMAVGTITMVDFDKSDEETSDELSAQSSETPFLLSQDLLATLVDDDAEGDQVSDHDPEDFFASAQVEDVDPEYREDLDVDADLHTFSALAVDNVALPDIVSLNKTTEELMVVWDDAAGTPPELSLSENSDDPWVTDIRSGNDTIAHVRSDTAITEDDVSFIPLSTAQALGWVTT